MSFLAPQAYTKETLAKAFDWLQHQPVNVKQVATSPDVLVGLFLKAQRQGITHIDADAPVSSKKFIDDLKNLKKEFAVFDEPKSPAAPAPHAPGAPAEQPVIPQPFAQPSQQHVPQGASAAPPQPPSYPVNPVYHQPAPAPTYSVAAVQTPSLALDETSLKILHNVQQRFNLSSPQEALRMVISVGYQHISRWQ
jgi:hypothetical protein